VARPPAAPQPDVAPPSAPSPVITERLIPYDAERCGLTEDYLRVHHPGLVDGFTEASCEMTPKLIVLHWTGGGTAESAWNTFASTMLGGRPELVGAGAVNVSAHFVVERDGSILRLLPDTTVARHVIGLNHLSIGIENVGGGDELPLTDAQVQADAALVRVLVAEHPITHLIGHHEYRQMERHAYFQEADPSYRTSKRDPGSAFMAEVRALVEDLGLEGPPPPPEL